MKKTIKTAVTVMMLSALTALTAFAYSDRIRDIPSVKITVKTGDLQPGDELSDDAISYVSYADNAYYYIDDAEWIDNVENLKVGAEPRMRVYVSAIPKETSTDRYNTIYLFRNSYNSGNVHISNGEFISADRRDNGYTLEVTLRVKPVRGQYDSPDNAYWTASRGTAKWDEPENGSGYYDVFCYRGSSLIKKLTNYHGNSYNFYPYMTKSGEYSFKVRTVAPSNLSNSVGKSSDWINSDYLELGDDQVSDGSGQGSLEEDGTNGLISGNNYPNGTGNANVAGWVEQGADTYFRYPNGAYVKDGWLKLDGKYYLFDKEGHMQRGWAQNKYGIWFYLEPTTGEMRTGWLRYKDHWYFLNTTKDEFEGCMVRGWWTYNGKTYYFNEEGIMVTGWYEVDGKWHYFYPEGSTDGAYGYMATNTKIGAFYVNAEGVWE